MADKDPRRLAELRRQYRHPNQRRADQITARGYNQLGEAVERATNPPLGFYVKQVDIGERSKTPTGGAVNVGAFTVDLAGGNVAADYVEGVPVGGGAVVRIAKPAALRGYLNDRTIFGEAQTVWPRYGITSSTGGTPSIIFAIEVGAAVTGVPGADWIDLNTDARQWVRQF